MDSQRQSLQEAVEILKGEVQEDNNRFHNNKKDPAGIKEIIKERLDAHITALSLAQSYLDGQLVEPMNEVDLAHKIMKHSYMDTTEADELAKAIVNAQKGKKEAKDE